MGQTTGIQWTNRTWTPIRARVRVDAGEIAAQKGYTSLLPTIVPGRIGPHCEHVSRGCDHCYSEKDNRRCLPKNGTGLPFDRRSRDLVDIFVDERILEEPFHWRKPKKTFVCSQTDLFGEWVPDEAIDRVFTVIAACPRQIFQVLTKRPERMQAYLGDKSVLPNCWLGVSVEDRAVLHRIETLRQTPAGLRFLSIEPLLEDLGPLDLKGIGWCIIGGESGPRARPCDLAWMRGVVEQCQGAGVQTFVKQLGRHPVEDGLRLSLNDKKGGAIAEFPADLRLREFPDAWRSGLDQSRCRGYCS